MTSADLLSRILIQPAELPVGLLTSAIGAPFFLWLIIKIKKMSIEIKNISLNIDNKSILKNINLKVIPGEILSIIGPNGAGKSSLINLVAGDYLPSEGIIFYDKNDLRTLSLEEKSRKRSVMGQFSKIAFDFKVKEVIQFGWVENGIEIFLKSLKI